jgi:hypothetical protein
MFLVHHHPVHQQIFHVFCALQILSHEINHGYKLGMLPLETFNATPVQNLAHLAHLVDSSDDPYLNFGLDGGRFITLDRQQVGALADLKRNEACVLLW